MFGDTACPLRHIRCAKLHKFTAPTILRQIETINFKSGILHKFSFRTLIVEAMCYFAYYLSMLGSYF